MRSSEKPVTICVLCYGDHFDLAKRCLDSIVENCDPEKFILRVGLNECCKETVEYVSSVDLVDSIYLCRRNINQCPMMARMLYRLETEFVWWFDDDSYINHHGALEYRLRSAAEFDRKVVMWGEVAFHRTTDQFADPGQLQEWINGQEWSAGYPAPSGKTSYDPEHFASGNRTWHFCAGGSWFARSFLFEELKWPPPSLIKKSNDVLLGEAIRQSGYSFFDFGGRGVKSSAAERRGTGEDAQTMVQQLTGG